MKKERKAYIEQLFHVSPILHTFHLNETDDN